MAPEISVENFEAGLAEHRVEKPAVRAELAPHVIGKLAGGPPHGRVRDCTGHPRLDAILCLRGTEVEDEIAQPEDAAGPEERGHPVQRDGLPEVGQMMEGVAREDHVGRFVEMLVGQEAAIDDRHVVEAQVLDVRTDRCCHRGRDIHRNDVTADERGGERERARPRAEVDDDRVGSETVASKRIDVLTGIEPRLAVVAGHVARIEMLPAREGAFVGPPPLHGRESVRGTSGSASEIPAGYRRERSIAPQKRPSQERLSARSGVYVVFVALSQSDPSPLQLPADAEGVLPSQYLRAAVRDGIVDAGEYKIPDSSIQPASIDLRLGEVAYRIRCSFLPDSYSVDEKRKELVIDELDLRREGAVLETNRPYLIPLVEELNLPPNVRGKANPKSSTGRLDVFTRVITDNSYRFDEIALGYRGKLYLEVVPLSFTVRVREGISLNQLRLSVGRSALTDQEIRELHGTEPILYRNGQPLAPQYVATADGVFVGLDLRGDEAGRVGYRAKDNAPLLEMSRVGAFATEDYWEPVFREQGDRIVLAPGRFYLLLSDENVRIPPDYAAEMTAYDPTSGELRTHYAGFFDPGFGYDTEGEFFGSRAALEVRAHDVPFMIEHGQRVCKLTFERMLERPDVLYGDRIGSSYQRQVDTLGKHFRPSTQATSKPAGPRAPNGQPGLFDDGSQDAEG